MEKSGTIHAHDRLKERIDRLDEASGLRMGYEARSLNRGSSSSRFLVLVQFPLQLVTFSSRRFFYFSALYFKDLEAACSMTKFLYSKLLQTPK